MFERAKYNRVYFYLEVKSTISLCSLASAKITALLMPLGNQLKSLLVFKHIGQANNLYWFEKKYFDTIDH